MANNAKAVRIAVLSTLLAPALCAGLATAAHAGTLKKDGCTVTTLKPVENLPRTTSIKRINYKIKATCGPHIKLDVRQIVWEDDGLFDYKVGQRNRLHNFNHSSGKDTKYFNWQVKLPDTEGGREEMFHEISFRVRSGPLVGNWTGWTSSSHVSFTN